MTFQELTTAVKELPREELRGDHPELIEIVFTTAQIVSLTPLLDSFFGSALKPAGQNPDGQAKKVTQDVGGIRKEQTLYYMKKDPLQYWALLWPWSNGQSVTLRLFQD